MGGSDFPGITANCYEAFEKGFWSSDECKLLCALEQENPYRATVNGKRFLVTTVVLVRNAVDYMTQGLTSEESWPYIMMMLSMKYKWGVNEWIKYGAELRKKFVELEAELEEKLKTKMKPDKVAAIRAAANYRVDTKDADLGWEDIIQQVKTWLLSVKKEVLEREKQRGKHGDMKTAQEMFAMLGIADDPTPCQPPAAVASRPTGAAAAAAAASSDPTSSYPGYQKPWQDSFLRTKQQTTQQGFKQLLQGIKVRFASSRAVAEKKVATIAKAAAAPFNRQTRATSRKELHSNHSVPSSHQQNQTSRPIPPPRQDPASIDASPPSTSPSAQQQMDTIIDQAYQVCHGHDCNEDNTTQQALAASTSDCAQKFADASETIGAGLSAKMRLAALQVKEASVESLHEIDALITKQPAKMWEADVMEALCTALRYSTGVAQKSKHLLKLDKEEEGLARGGAAGEFAVRVVSDVLGDEYAAKSFGLVAVPKSGTLKDTFGRSVDSKDPKLPPAVGLHLSDVCYVANEISFQRSLATQACGLVVPVSGWFLETIERAGYRVLCITMLMPYAGYDLLDCKRLLVNSPIFSSLGGPDKLTRNQQLVLTAVAWCVAKGVGEALAAIHASRTRHGDIKMTNIVLQGSFSATNTASLLKAFLYGRTRCQLLDFGSASAARMIRGNIVFSNPRADGGTEDTLPPEYVDANPEDLKNVAVIWAQKADIWALGMSLVFTLFWAAAIHSQGDSCTVRAEISRYIEKANKSRIQDCKGSDGILQRRDVFLDALVKHSKARGFLDHDLIDLIKAMLHEDPEKRPSAEEVINWGNGLLCAKVNKYQQEVEALLG